MEVFSTVISALLCVVVGSALGGTARYFVSGVVARRLGETFPWGTMIVNVTGAFLIGILGALALALERIRHCEKPIGSGTRMTKPV